MIVTCSECDTQFKLDESKIVGSGLNVRCSVCKHAFFVTAPGPDDGEGSDPFDRVANAAIEAAFSDLPGPTPDVTRDLIDAGAESPVADEGGIASAIGSDSDIGPQGLSGGYESHESHESHESDWEFSREPESEARASLPEKAPTITRATAAERAVDDLLGPGPTAQISDASEDSDESESSLGNPEDWDFFGNEGGDLGDQVSKTPAPAARSAIAEPDFGASASAISGRRSAPTEPLDSTIGPNAGFTDDSTGVGASAECRIPLPGFEADRPMSKALRHSGNVIGWISVIALVTLGIHSGLNIRRLAPTPLETQRVGGMIVESIEGQWIENILAGPLFVVSGTLRNDAGVATTSGSVLVLRLYNASGQPLDSVSAVVGPALSEQQIRESGPDELIARLELGAARAAREPLGRGETRSVHAILTDVPAAAASFRLESAPLSFDVP